MRFISFFFLVLLFGCNGGGGSSDKSALVVDQQFYEGKWSGGYSLNGQSISIVLEFVGDECFYNERVVEMTTTISETDKVYKTTRASEGSLSGYNIENSSDKISWSYQFGELNSFKILRLCNTEVGCTNFSLVTGV